MSENFRMKIWSRRIAQNMNEKFWKILPYLTFTYIFCNISNLSLNSEIFVKIQMRFGIYKEFNPIVQFKA